MIIPSIDLMNGKVVQLEQGKTKKLELKDIDKIVDDFSVTGRINLIDLDGAKGKGDNSELIKKICRKASCVVGGGIRTTEKAEEMIKAGAKKVIVSSAVFEGSRVNRKFLEELNEKIGRKRTVIAVDSRAGYITIRGWEEKTKLKTENIIKELETYCSEFLLTCVDKEGLMKGTDIEFIKEIRKVTKNELTAAGGISSYEEIKKLEEINVNSVLGMALYTGKISLDDAFIATLDLSKGLIPTVVQDEAGQVLMLAYSSMESVKKIFETRKGWYFSRSRNRPWMKGEISGNTQDVLKIQKDCDGDALLLKVKQKNVACHKGKYSCFGDREFSLNELYDVIMDRKINPSDKSYTSSLFSHRKGTNKILEKVGEEATELIIAAKTDSKEETLYEMGDLLYHCLVLLAEKEVSFEELKSELAKRRK